MKYIQKYLYKIFTGLFVLSLLVACDGAADSPYSAIIFQPQHTMSLTGRSSAVGFAIDGKGYVALGRIGVRYGALKDCWEFNPDSDTWTQKANFPGVARVKATAVVSTGLAYVGLGFDPTYGYYNAKGHPKDFWSFDPKLNTWTQKADFPNEYTDACISFAYKNTIYVGFGFNGTYFTSELWKYKPAENTWSKLTSFPGDGRVGAVCCTNGEHVYFGTGYATLSFNDWWEYFPDTNSWKQLKAIPDKGRENGVSLCVNDRFFVSTGRYFHGMITGGNIKSDILEYNPGLNVWYERGNIPNGNRENAVSFTINGKGYIGFGENDSVVLNDFWSFEP
jgi:N-acetylneuraminic acid mutarotase